MLSDFLPNDPLMQQAFADCLLWSVTEPDILAAFRTETGCQWSPGATPLERMIDEAAGADTAFCEQYIPWFTRTVWGMMEEPVTEILERLPRTKGEGI